MSKTLKIIGLCFLVLIVIVFASNVFFGRNMPRQQPTPPAATDPARTPAPGEVTNYYTQQRINTAQRLLERSLPSSGYDVSWRYDNVNGYCFFDIVASDIDREVIENAKNDVGTYRRDWDQLVDNIKSIQKSIQKIFTEAEDDTVIIVDLLNPDNTDEVWLSVANGVAGYDVVNEIDLYSEGS